jgi:hypothetical protein
MEFKKVLKVLAREGYPNPNLDRIFDALDYDGENFLIDLIENLGEEGATDFVKKALSKLSSGIHSEIKIRIPKITGYPDAWIDLIIHDVWIDLDESENDVMVNYSFGDNKIYDDEGNETTLEELEAKVDMGDWNEWDDFKDWIKSAAYDYISTRCGFSIWYQ